uniref:NET domain-containing protein n=1 Tax=viral metagenome TaxID=1070528 RepID=A0A6C0LI63_9ZZZZ
MENIDKNEIYKNIKIGLENLSQNELEEIFKIIYKNNNNYSKNNNGVFINLCWLDNDTLLKINNYINFCIKSHNEITKYEVICNMLNDSITNTKDKIEEVGIVGDMTNIDMNKINKQKISSSMKFYLLKKKFQKQQLATNIESYLTHDECLLR